MSMIWIVVAIGVVLVLVLFLMLAGSGGPLAVETRGQRDMVHRRMKDPAVAILQVTGISEPSFDAMDCTGTITGMVSGDGIEPQAVRRKAMIQTARWPKVGQQLPVLIDRANPKLFFVDWSDGQGSADVALDKAEALAATMRARNGNGAP